MVIDKVDDSQQDKSQGSDMSLLMAGLGPSSEDYYPTVVINALLKILKDPSLSQQYQPATQAILNIFQALQLKMVPFLPQVSPVLCYQEVFSASKATINEADKLTVVWILIVV